jgi:flagellar biosynthesis/type III secretory pathway ATPase
MHVVKAAVAALLPSLQRQAAVAECGVVLAHLPQRTSRSAPPAKLASKAALPASLLVYYVVQHCTVPHLSARLKSLAARCFSLCRRCCCFLQVLKTPVSRDMLGRIFNGSGRPIDGG